MQKFSPPKIDFLLYEKITLLKNPVIDIPRILREMLHAFFYSETFEIFGLLEDNLQIKYFLGQKANTKAKELKIEKVFLDQSGHHLANGMGANVGGISAS